MNSENRFWITISFASVMGLAIIVCLMLGLAMIITAETGSQSATGVIVVVLGVAIFIATLLAIIDLTKEETREQ